MNPRDPIFLNKPWADYAREQRRERYFRILRWMAYSLAWLIIGASFGYLISSRRQNEKNTERMATTDNHRGDPCRVSGGRVVLRMAHLVDPGPARDTPDPHSHSVRNNSGSLTGCRNPFPFQ